MKLLADASLPHLIEAFPKPFELSTYQHNDEVSHLLEKQDILLCRSTLKVNQSLLQHPHALRYVATASSGHDHIDLDYLQKRGIEWFDAKGCNAKSVADYVMASIAFLQTYYTLRAKKAGIIGLGPVGLKVKTRLLAMGMQVCCYDPPKSKQDPLFESCTLDALRDCDLLCVHANLHEQAPYPSKNLLDTALLNQLKPGCIIINAARGGIVNEHALLPLIKEKKLIYCTDVYENEPAINPDLVKFALICTPHIAGHSIEAKQQAVWMLSEKLHACYQVIPPQRFSFPQQALPLQTTKNWQDSILSLYNPQHETETLKNASHLSETFTALRQAHQHRHDFCRYNLTIMNKKELSRILEIT